MRFAGKVFGIGLSRTGTSSLTAALRTLGFESIHFPHDGDTIAQLTPFLHGRGGAVRLTALKSVQAMTDTPISATYQNLDAGYPGSKFILTDREPEMWLASCQRYWEEVLLPLLRSRPKILVSYIEAVNIANYGTAGFDAALFQKARRRHLESVFAYFMDRPEDLLVMNLARNDPWEALCRFLGTETPVSAFPHLNSLLQK